VSGASVVVRAGSEEFQLEETAQESCVVDAPDIVAGTCYLLEDERTASITPGVRLELEISLPSGGSLWSEVTIPGDFDIVSPQDKLFLLPESTTFQAVWTKSQGACAYVNETLVTGLSKSLDLDPDDDAFEILGVSATELDTTATFPDEFGTFSRFELRSEVNQALTGGLPKGARAEIVLVAVEQNYVNWARGERGFNPVGEVRIPSISGDGTGVFGASVTRRFQVLTEDDGGMVATCGAAVPLGGRNGLQE